MSNSVIDIIIGMVSSGGLLVVVWQTLSGMVDRERKRRSARTFLDVRDIYETIGRVLNKTSAVRVVVMVSHNGGGIPTPLKSTYTTVLYDAHGADGKDIRAQWQARPVDREFAEILGKIASSDDVNLDVSKMKLKGALWETLDSQGISRAWVFPIGQFGGVLTFVSMHFSGEAEELTTSERAVVSSARVTLARTFSRHAALVEPTKND